MTVHDQQYNDDSASDAVAAGGQPPAVDIAVQNMAVVTTASGVVQAHTITGGVHHHHYPAPLPQPVPRQLPPVPHGFVGRVGHLADLDHRAPSTVPDTSLDGQHGAPVVVISAIGGTGGIGKTWLALTWAHRSLHRFPDGQLFADLRGFSPTGRPAHPVDVLGGFLDALGVDRDRQPNDPDRCSELYRSLVADKRMLVVLDNAATTDQVIPLLPGGHHCVVVVTSRNHLHGLIARHGAHPIHLDVLTDTEAHTLLTTTLGLDRAATDKRAIAELIRLCGRFPLALGVIAARAAAEPHLPLGDTVDELRALGLGALGSDDPTASLPTVLSWSLHHLTNQQCQMFALLSIAPGPDIGLPAAASLTGLPEHETHMVLRTLVEVSLIDRTPGVRYVMHDLVRAYATTIARDLPDEVREKALRRVIDFYIHTADDRARALWSYERSMPDGIDSFNDNAAAMAWFDAEHTHLLAAQRTATAHAWHGMVYQLAQSLATFQLRRGHRYDRLAMWQAALDAATHLTNPAALIDSHRLVGLCYAHLEHDEKAIEHLTHAKALAEHHHNLGQQAMTLRGLSKIWTGKGDKQRALDHASAALDLFRTLDKQPWEVVGLGDVAWCLADLEDYDNARASCERALTVLAQHPDLWCEGSIQNCLGRIADDTGDHHGAVHHYRKSLAIDRTLGHATNVANTLNVMGSVHAVLGQHKEARRVWREALQLYQEQGRGNHAARVQRHLDNLNTHNHDDDKPPQDTATAT